MVPSNGRALDHRPKPLNEPVEVSVQEDQGQPLAVQRSGWSRPRPVLALLDRWRIDDEWWRERPISRMYHVLIVEGDVRLTIYHDLIVDAWYEQADRAHPQAPKPPKRSA